MITMTDVARHAGVTTATVSHVITGNVAVREPTRQRVQAAIDQLGYRPNLLARALSQGTTRLLVLLIPAMCDHQQMQAVTCIVATAEAAQCHVFLSVCQDEPFHHVARFLPYHVGGLLVLEATLAYVVAQALVPLELPMAFCVPAVGCAEVYHPVLIQAPRHPLLLSPSAGGTLMSSSSIPIVLSTTARVQEEILDLASLEPRVQAFLTDTPQQAGTLSEAASTATHLLLTALLSSHTSDHAPANVISTSGPLCDQYEPDTLVHHTAERPHADATGVAPHPGTNPGWP